MTSFLAAADWDAWRESVADLALKGGDTLDGGSGNDMLEGSWGADRIVFRTVGGHDTITDFGSETIHDDSGEVVGWDHDLIVIKGGKTYGDLTIKENADGAAAITGHGADAGITPEGVSASELTEPGFGFRAETTRPPVGGQCGAQ